MPSKTTNFVDPSPWTRSAYGRVVVRHAELLEGERAVLGHRRDRRQHEVRFDDGARVVGVAEEGIRLQPVVMRHPQLVGRKLLIRFHHRDRMEALVHFLAVG